jgi:NodT family efflux transporter outer membrane factor (OMF) lipoprotein
MYKMNRGKILSMLRSFFSLTLVPGVKSSCIASVLFLASACTTLGPDFTRPATPEPAAWLEQDPGVLESEAIASLEWWQVFNDPVLNSLVDMAYQQNLSLQIAGLRILEARAQLGIAIGSQYPQQQQVGGSATKNRLSENSPNFSPAVDKNYMDYQVGFDAAWEIDFWGRFRRGIEAANADLSASVADYQDALVSLTAEVARTYVIIRTLEERLVIAEENIKLQTSSLRIANIRFTNGATTELDVQQAIANLSETKAQVPALQQDLRQAKNSLSILLGKPPSELTAILGGAGIIPVAPARVAVGVPAELLRRRPDVQLAEMQAAGQSALVGVARTELFPRFSLLGSIGYVTSDTNDSSSGDLFDSGSLTYYAGPTFQWNILNYGRLKNNVRVQDARYQQAIVNYQNTVLNAYKEVEDAMVAFIQSQQESSLREEAAMASKKSTEIANIQYREGAVDFQRVIDSERTLVLQQDNWTNTRGEIALNLIAMYKALGGGWESRTGDAFVSEDNRVEMKERTDWGDLLEGVDTEDFEQNKP